ncbi:putative E3 ubiquitin-protein ligase dtx2 [Mortierella sp. 14UC]|nr:putative E3 ubiquitin-protein ligase dtx2 [Mortierella sp. 14UC]
MPSSSNRPEASDLFREFFENCSPEFEQAHAVPFDTAMPSSTSSVYPHLQPNAAYGLDPQTALLNLTHRTHPELCSNITNKFLSHTRIPEDYRITSVQVLKNPLIWARYQAEKQLRRKLAAERRDMFARERAKGSNSVHCQSPSAANEEDPEELYRDEILYHGTHQQRIPAILINGLEPRMTVRASYGQGVYFSDSIEKCMQYVDYQASMEQEYSIVMCSVLLGRVMVEAHDKTKRNMNPQVKFLPPSFDSAVVIDTYKEWIIMEKSQILPLCVINFKTCNHADAYHRLGSFQSLFQGTSRYPGGMHEIQKVCNVLVPFDNNAIVHSHAQAEELRDPDNHEHDMLFNIFDFPHNKAKVRNFFIGGVREWLFVAPDMNGAVSMFYVTEPEYNQLIAASKNIQLLRARLDEDRISSNNAVRVQQFSIVSEIKFISNGDALVNLLTAKLAEIQRVETEGQEVLDLVNSLKRKALVIGGHQYLAFPEVANVIHPHESKLRELEAKFAHLKTLFVEWTPHEFSMGKRVVAELRPALERDIMENKARADRQAAAIEAERARTFHQSKLLIKHVTELQAQERLERSKTERSQASSFGHKECFVMKPVDVDTSRTRSWPLIAAELLMPMLMIHQLKPEVSRHLNDTNWVNEAWRIRNVLALPHAKVWWDVVPEVLFGGPTPQHSLWPVDPRKRVPNDSFFTMKDYLLWIFKEKESRPRHFNQHHNTIGSTTQGAAASTASQAPTIEEQWNQVDPSLVQAINGLSSRHGLVEFNRERRQADLDRMGGDLTGDLMVPAEPHMLLREGVGGDAKSGSSEKAECPICQDELVSTTSTTPGAEPEKVVKLKSCRHCFHKECIDEWFKSPDAQLKCPLCNVMCTTAASAERTKKAFLGYQKLGPQPDGVLGYFFDVRLCCYFIYMVMPTHTIPDPTAANPNAIKTVPSDVRHAIVPFTSRLGPLLMMRILTLFYYGHLFKVGQSLTRGVCDVVVWNGVHLRTSMSGQFGFPAPNWEQNCWEEINQKGIALGLDELILSVPAADGRTIRRDSAQSAQASAQGVVIPADLAAEMAADETTQRIFHQDQPPLFVL